MSILSRFRDVMASNWNVITEKSEDPALKVDAMTRSLNQNLGQLQAETAAAAAEERRAQRALDTCREEIRKLQRYAEKAAEAGDSEQARKFQDKHSSLAASEAQLEADYEAAAFELSQMNQLQGKLAADVRQLEERHRKLKETLAATRVQQRINAMGSPLGGMDTQFEELEKKAQQAYDEAMAIAELRRDPRDRLNEELEQLDNTSKLNTEEQ